MKPNEAKPDQSPCVKSGHLVKHDLAWILDIGTSNDRQNCEILRTAKVKNKAIEKSVLFCSQIVDNLSETLY